MKKYCVIYKKDNDFILKSDEKIFEGKDSITQESLDILHMDMFKDITIITDEFLSRKIKHDTLLSTNFFLPSEYIFDFYRSSEIEKMNLTNKTDFNYPDFLNEPYIQTAYNLYIGKKNYDRYVLKSKFFNKFKFYISNFKQFESKLDKYKVYFLTQAQEGYFIVNNIIFENKILNEAFNTQNSQILVPFFIFRNHKIIDYDLEDIYFTANRKSIHISTLNEYNQLNIDLLGELYLKHQILDLFIRKKLKTELIDLRKFEFYSPYDLDCNILLKVDS